MRLTVIGSSGTAPTAGNPGSGYLVSSGDSHVLLDAGPGVVGALSGVIDPFHLTAVVLSHRHPDHCSDIFALYHYLAYGDRVVAQPIPVFAPPGLAEAAAAFVDADVDPAWHTVFDWRIAEGEAALGDRTLRFGEASHSVPAVCVRVGGDGGAIAYSGDTGPGSDLEALAQGVEVLLCEASFQDDTHDDYPFHLSASQAGAIAAEVGARRLVLTHLRSTLDPGRSVAEASATFGAEALVAVPGMTIDLREAT